MTNFTCKEGWLVEARHVVSPNFNERPNLEEIYLIVIHNISLPPEQFGGGYIENFFQNKLDTTLHPYFKTIEGVEVSAHLLITRLGEVIQFVSFNDRAWHAGQSCYLGVANCNDYSIGIELEGADNIPYTNEQYQALTAVIATLNVAYPLTNNHLTGHSDIAPIRKTDPSASFDWQRLRSQLSLTKTLS